MTEKTENTVTEYDRVEAPSLKPFYAAGVFWIVYALLFPLYLWWHFAIPALLSAGLFVLLKKVCKPRYITVPVKVTLSDDEVWSRNAEEYLKKLREADIAIEDEEVSKKIRRVELSAEEIFSIGERDKSKRPQIRRFMQYYLPTLLKLLSAYDGMEDVTNSGANIKTSREKISNLLDTAVSAFSKLSDELYAADSIDISSDISVFNTLLKREGLIDENEEKGENGNE